VKPGAIDGHVVLGWTVLRCVGQSEKCARGGGPPDWLELSESFGGGKDFLGVGEEGFLERGSVRDWGVEGSDADERAVEIVEGFFEEDGGNFAGDATGLGVFMNDEALIGFLDGSEDGFFVERHKRAEIDDFRLNAFFGEGVGGFERDVHHGGVGEDGEVLPFPANDGFAKRNGVVIGGNFFLDAAV